MKDALHWIRFQQLFGYGSARSEQVLACYGHPGMLFDSDLQRLSSDGILTRKELLKLSASTSGAAQELYDHCQRLGVTILTPGGHGYPKRLEHIYARPTVLYAEGQLGDIDDLPAIGMVGTRSFTEYGRQVADTLSKELASCGFVVVSGMAQGIDTICHAGALKAGGRTIAVTGSGADFVYPAGNRELKRLILKSGAVISEYPPGTAPMPAYFPVRNRIISGISLGVVVVEGRRRSGSLITAGHALTQGRDVFSVPGSIFSPESEGTHWLLRQGAIPATSALDIIEEYLPLYYEKLNNELLSQLRSAAAPKPKAANKAKNEVQTFPQQETLSGTPAAPGDVSARTIPITLSAAQRTVLEGLGREKRSVDELANTLELPVKEILSALTQLEIYGLIEAHPGRCFSATW